MSGKSTDTFSSWLKTSGVKFSFASAASASTVYRRFGSKYTLTDKQQSLTVLHETFAEVEPAEHAKDGHEDQDDERQSGDTCEEAPVHECPTVYLRVEHDRPTGDINK